MDNEERPGGQAFSAIEACGVGASQFRQSASIGSGAIPPSAVNGPIIGFEVLNQYGTLRLQSHLGALSSNPFSFFRIVVEAECCAQEPRGSSAIAIRIDR